MMPFDEINAASLMMEMRSYVFPDHYKGRGDLQNILSAMLDKEQAERFVENLPEIKRLVWTDVEAVLRNDPAVSSIDEVILTYPATKVMLHYRTAHVLYLLDVPILPRMLTEIAHSCTGVDIHPGAEIGEYFGIDHGTGIVVGETCIIGSNVMVYQGVTLGALNFKRSSGGRPENIPRHPIIGDNVTIYAGATLLGRIMVGHDSVIGGNVWLTQDVPPGSKIVQGRARVSHLTFTDGAGI